MKKMIPLTTVAALFGLSAQAAPLAPKEADAICRKKVVAAARFVFDSQAKLRVSYRASNVYEISTPIAYEFRVPGVDDAVVTVQAFAYPEDRSCIIGSVVNHIAGND